MIDSLLIYIGLSLVALIVCIFIYYYIYPFLNKKLVSYLDEKKKSKPIKSEELKTNSNKKTFSFLNLGVGNLIGGFVVILVGVNLIPTIANQVSEVQNSQANVTGASSTILGLTTRFFALGILGAGIMLAVNVLRGAGLL